jgi:hypothetical protein
MSLCKATGLSLDMAGHKSGTGNAKGGKKK